MQLLLLCLLLFSSSFFADVQAASPGQELRDGVQTFREFLRWSLESERVQTLEQKPLTDLFADPQGLSGREEDLQRLEPFVTFREGANTISLYDVPRTEWFAPYVRDMVDRRIVTGYRDQAGKPTGEFGPARNVSVEELSKMAMLAAAIDVNECVQTGSGALRNQRAKQSWSQDYIHCAERRGWALFGDGTIDIKRPATRSEVSVTVIQAFNASPREITASGSLFSDVGAATQYAGAIATAALDGIVAGYPAAPNTLPAFKPTNPINRAEVAKILSIAIQVYRQ